MNSAFYFTSTLTVPVVLIALNILWVYLFAILLRNYYRTPSIDRCRNKVHSTCCKLSQTNDKVQHDDVNMPHVSIIIPARNEQNHITRCLTSLLGQNYTKLEIIAVNDNSSDNTLKIMQEIQSGLTNEDKKPLSQQQYEQWQENPEFPYLNSNNILSTNSNILTSVQKGKISDGTVTISSKKDDFKSINYGRSDKKSFNRLKIVSLIKDRPLGWTGKTWASQQGYLCSKGDILIFTDADTLYMNSDTISSSISYFEKENLDVLTGFPFIELRDFWSKIVNPVWKLIGTLFGYNITDINNPKSDAASLMGCFIVIKRKTFENIGTYKMIRSNIREDEALGIRAKQMGYKIRGLRMDKSLSALWSSDLQTLWNGIARTIMPALLNMNGKKRRRRVIYDLLTIFFMAVLPFVMLPYSLAIMKLPDSMLDNYIIDSFYSTNSIRDQARLIYQIHFTTLLLNLSACIGLFVGSTVNAIRVFKISPIYAIMSPVGAVFLLVAYISSILPLIIHPKKLKPLIWRDRKYLPDQ